MLIVPNLFVEQNLPGVDQTLLESHQMYGDDKVIAKEIARAPNTAKYFV